MNEFEGITCFYNAFLSKAKTKSLDGVLVKIALEKLREKFPDKYVSVKSNSDGQFVVVNDFIKK